MSAKENGRRPQINPPRGREEGGVEYLRECVFAVDPSVVSLIEAAAMAGWSRKEVVLAIMLAAGDYFRSSGMQFDLDDVHFIGPQDSDLLN
jgi:hypothetical protein